MKKSNFGILGAVSALCLFSSVGAFAYGGFSAIVYNTQTGIYGTSWSNDPVITDGSTDSFDRGSAETRALNACDGNTSNPNTCNITIAQLEQRPYATAIVETYATNGWVALATGPSSTWGTSGCNNPSIGNCHDTEQDAESTAVAACNAKAGSNNACRVIRSFASLTNSYDVQGVAAQ